MSVRARYALSAAVSSTTAEERDLGSPSWGVVTDQETKGGTWTTLLTAGAADVQLQIDNISSIALIIIRTRTLDPNATPVTITIKRNTTGNEALPITPLGDATEGHFLMSTSSLTALYASNPGAVDMQVTIVAVGT